MNRDMLSRRLKKRGDEVSIAVDGAEGRRAATAARDDGKAARLNQTKKPEKREARGLGPASGPDSRVRHSPAQPNSPRSAGVTRGRFPIVVPTTKNLTEADHRRSYGGGVGLIEKSGIGRKVLTGAGSRNRSQAVVPELNGNSPGRRT